MKLTCQYRRKAAWLYVFTVISAFTGLQSMANPFNDGTTHTNITDTVYNETLYVGIQNPGNTLLITSNSTVSATDVVIGQLNSSTNNTLSVIGDALLIAGDATTNGLTTGGVIVGGSDDGAALMVNNSSTLNTEYLYVGFGASDSGTIELSGEGTMLNIAQDALVGTAGSTNSIEISDGANMSVGGTLTVGSITSSDNRVNVASGGSLYVNSTNNINVVNADDDNGIKINGGGTLQIGGDVNTGTLGDLSVEMAKKSTLELGGTLTIDKNRINNSLNVILNNTLSTNTATWSSSSLTVIGSTTSDNSLTFTNGATGHALNIVQIGQQSTAARNELNIGGSNSLFTADTDVFLGAQGKDNQLNIGDGGQMDVAGSLYLGNNSTATGNKANVNSNGTLNVEGSMVIGDYGANNELNINYGSVSVGTDMVLGKNSGNNNYDQTGGTNTVAGAFVIGMTGNATGETGFVNDDRVETTGNLAIIGTNATLNIQQDLTVGMAGGGSIMTIRDGGTVNVDGNVVIGEAVGDNYIYLQRDADTRLNVSGDLVVGVEGGSNRFAEYGGTANIGGNLYLGASTNQHEIKNFIHLETTNAVLNVADGIYIGASNSVNTLDIVDGATANVYDMYVGFYDGVSNNVVTVRGEDSLLNITNTLTIGSATGSNNQLIVENGGILSIITQTNMVIKGTNNNLNIADGGTLQTMDWNTAVADTNIIMEAGSILELGGAYTGTSQLDNPYELVLNGALSTNAAVWTTGSDILYVGYAANDNILTVKDGGLVTTATNLIVGRSSKTIRNTLNATGVDSQINIGNNLIVGNTGSSRNKLTVEDAGQIHVGNNFILGSKSSQNTALVTGSTNGTSMITIDNLLTIGNGLDATDNLLEISSNATVNVFGIATIGSGSDDNTLKLTGTNALLTAYSNLVVGAGAASGNELTVSEGTVTVSGNLIIGRDKESTGNSATVSGSNALIEVSSSLYVGKDGNENSLSIAEGGTVESLDAYVGFTTNSHNNSLSITGTNSSLTIAGTLYAGYEGDDNSIDITDGALLQVSDAYIGYESSGNTIEVHGTNAVFDVLNDLFIGNTATNTTGLNKLWVYEDAITTVGGNMTVQSNSVLYIETGSQVAVAGNYSQDETSRLALRINTNSATIHLTVGATASFAKDTTFQLQGDDTVVGTTNKIARALVSAAALEIDEQAATQDLLNDSINIANDLLKFNLILSNNVIWVDNVTRLSLAETSGLEPGSQLANVADDIDFMADSSNEVAVTMRDFMDTELDSTGRNTAFHNYYGEKMSSSPAHNAINMGLQSVSEQLTRRADSTRARMGMASVSGPDGAGGPHAEGQPFQGWIAGYKTWANKSADSGFDGYDGSIGGFLVGADISVAQGILMGIAGGQGTSTLDKDNGASSDTDSVFGSVYLSAGTKDWFADASLIYGGSSIDTALGSTFDTTASYDAQNTAIYFGGGKEITGNYLIITPHASLLANYYKQDGYEEKSSNAVGRQVDSFDALYLQSDLGCKVGFYAAMGNLTLKPEFRASWMHEFNAQDENVSFNLIGGTNPYVMTLQAKEEDIIKLGAGLSAKIGEYLELRADLDTRRGSNYSDHTLLGSLRYQF